jgi:hypothetical protein
VAAPDAPLSAHSQSKEWSSFMSATEFSIRACTGGPNATKLCPHIYDV